MDTAMAARLVRRESDEDVVSLDDDAVPPRLGRAGEVRGRHR